MGREKIRNHSLGINATERIFASTVLLAGLRVERSTSIRCDIPVPNKRGVPVKTVTTPDYLVTDPDTDRKMYVEVTKGNGNWPHKDAQRRVAQEAGIHNYLLLTGHQIQALLDEPTPEAIRTRLFELFAWDTDVKK